MACPRSIYPWDVVIQKLPGGTLFFDKRDDSQFDFLTVSETSNDTPKVTEDDETQINTPERLSLEATMINQNFSQQILRGGDARKSFDIPNPFFDEDDAEGMEPASVGYRYRRFNLGEEIKLVVRTELHGKVIKKGVAGTTEK
jgi:translation initiation factor 3 subunit D